MASPITIQQKLAGWRAAEQAANAERSSSLDATELLNAADEIRDLNPAAFEGSDPVREREVEAVRNAWKTLRERWRRDEPSSPRS